MPSELHTARRTRRARTAAAPLTVALVVALLAACSEPAPPPVPKETLRAPFLPMGTELVTFRDSEGLCLEAHFDDDDAGSGACGFREGPTSGRYVVSARDDGFLYAYGPVPAQTQTVRLRLGDGTRIEVSTAELPSSVARGRYFFAGLGMNVNLDSVTLLDPRGTEVEPLDF